MRVAVMLVIASLIAALLSAGSVPSAAAAGITWASSNADGNYGFDVAHQSTVTLRWGPVGPFDVEVRRAGMLDAEPRWRTWHAHTTLISGTVPIGAGKVVCVRARMSDPVGAWSTERCVIRQVDDTAAIAHGQVKRVAASAAFSADRRSTRLRNGGTLSFPGIPKGAYYAFIGSDDRASDTDDYVYYGLAGQELLPGGDAAGNPLLMGRTAHRAGTMVIRGETGRWSEHIGGIIVARRWTGVHPDA